MACRVDDFAVPANHRVKIKENEKIEKYLDLARELNKLWNMRVMMILIVIGAPGMVFKVFDRGLKQLEIRAKIEVIQTTASARILRKVLESWGDLLSLKSQ